MVRNEEERVLDRKIKILKKALNTGMKSEKAFSEQTAQDFFIMQKFCKFTDAEAEEFFRLAEAIKKKKLFDYLVGNGEYQNKEGGESDGRL